MKKLVIFDLDGTLIDSVADLANATNFALEKNGYPKQPVEKFYIFVGDGVQKLIERALPMELENKEEIAAKLRVDFNEYYNIHYADCTTIYDGINDVLSTLKDKGYIMSVLSNKPHNFCCTIVEEFFGDIFDYALGNSDLYNKKPSPEGIELIREKFDIDKSNCTIIGDSDIDIITGKNAEISTIGVSWGFRGEAELKSVNADAIAYTPKDIISILSK